MPETTRKSQIDAVLLKLPGVVSKKLNQLDAYFVNDRMFACISDKGLGLRLPAATVTNLQFSRGDVSQFQPGGLSAGATREWIQINCVDAADYEKNIELFKTSMECEGRCQFLAFGARPSLMAIAYRIVDVRTIAYLNGNAARAGV